jgi:peptidyl-tRNA hydrolase
MPAVRHPARNIGMSPGKIASQAGHAYLGALAVHTPDPTLLYAILGH